MMVLSSRSGLWGAFPCPIRGRHLFLCSGEEKQERADSGVLPSVSVWRLALSSWSMSRHASHLTLPSCPPLLMTTLTLPFSSSLIVTDSPSPFLSGTAHRGSQRYTSSAHSCLFLSPMENTGHLTQQFTVTALPFLLVSNWVPEGCLWVELVLGPKATLRFLPLPILRPFVTYPLCYCSNP